MVHDLPNSFYKKQVSTARDSDSANDTLSKFNTKIGRYPAMSFMVIRLKKEIFRGVFGTWENIYDGPFSKIGEIEI